MAKPESKISTVDARNSFSEVINRAAYGKERVVLTRRGAIVILMGIELMLNGANLAFITFARQYGTPEAQIYVFFVTAAFSRFLWEMD